MTDQACDCDRCRQLCTRNPGWFTPAEARAAIDEGYADRMMRDWLEPCEEVGNTMRIYVLAPAAYGYEGGDAREMSFFDFDFHKGWCVLQHNGLCEIHDTMFKPIQCRTAFGCDRDSDAFVDNYDVARLWDTDEGRDVVAAWEARTDQ